MTDFDLDSSAVWFRQLRGLVSWSLCVFQTDDRVSRGSNSSLSSCSSVSEQRGFFIGQEITEDAEMSSSSFT